LRRPSRRNLAAGATLALGGLLLARWWLPRSQRPGPVRGVADLSERGRAIVADALAGLDLTRVWDLHTHLVGLADGAEVNPAMTSHLHPWRRLQFEIYMAASGVRDLRDADEQYLARLLALQRAANPAGRLLLFAFDRRVNADGTEDPAGSPFYVPNERVLALAREHAEVEACASVHPYRKDALVRLEAARIGGARAIKWLPNAMGIDPASGRLDAYYDKLVELGLVLITHGGDEQAVEADADQELGNPLRLRRALERGVRVVIAHCATTGSARDLDAPAGAPVACFDLFLRLMGEAGPAGTLWGDISAIAQVNRSAAVLARLLLAGEIHGRLVYGSDYPLAAIDLLTSTRLLAHRDLIDGAERAALNEVFEANPLLFDLVLKRRMRAPSGAEGGGGEPARFRREVFESARLFD
jgi:mannonate dehydratase